LPPPLLSPFFLAAFLATALALFCRVMRPPSVQSSHPAIVRRWHGSRRRRVEENWIGRQTSEIGPGADLEEPVSIETLGCECKPSTTPHPHHLLAQSANKLAPFAFLVNPS
jgi:hypothetical protein